MGKIVAILIYIFNENQTSLGKSILFPTNVTFFCKYYILVYDFFSSDFGVAYQNGEAKSPHVRQRLRSMTTMIEIIIIEVKKSIRQ